MNEDFSQSLGLFCVLFFLIFSAQINLIQMINNLCFYIVSKRKQWETTLLSFPTTVMIIQFTEKDSCEKLYQTISIYAR